MYYKITIGEMKLKMPKVPRKGLFDDTLKDQLDPGEQKASHQQVHACRDRWFEAGSITCHVRLVYVIEH